MSSRVVSRSGGGGGGPYVLRQAIASRLEPRAEKGPPTKPTALGWRNTRIWLADDSGDGILDSDWLTKMMGSFVLNTDWLTTRTAEILLYLAQCNKIGYSSGQCIKMGYSSAQCIKIGCSSVPCIGIGNGLNHSFSALWDFFEKSFWTFS